mgnify:CR=1 FL=1
MRPIDRGEVPLVDGKLKVYKEYSRARRDLKERIGSFCSYCERYLPTNAAIEHVPPTSLVHEKKLDWSNFLLACTNCNSCKKDKLINTDNIDSFVWPDQDDTFHLIEYDTSTYMPKVKSGLKDEQVNKVNNTLSLVGLDKPAPKIGTISYEECSDMRVEQRGQAFDIANKYLLRFINAKNDAHRTDIIDGICDYVLASGFWSVWMAVFKNEKDVIKRLIDCIPGTNKEFLKEELA